MATFTAERLILDGLDLNAYPPDAAPRIVCEQIEWAPSKKLIEWVKNSQADGQQLLRLPRHDNATMTLTLRVAGASSMDIALNTIGAVSDKLRRAQALAAGGRDRGLALVVQPAGSNYTGTVYVLTGEIEDLPRTTQGDDAGWFLKAPVFKVRLDCSPFIYQAEVVYPASPAAQTTPVAILEVPDPGGDVPAEARLIVEETSGQDRHHLEWGIEFAGYDPATSLIVDSDQMVTAGYTGVQATQTGAYDPNASGNNVISATLAPSPVQICATPVLAHIGEYRVKARGHCAAVDQHLRLAWKAGDNPLSRNGYATPVAAGAFSELDLGVVRIPQAKLGAQRFLGIVEGYADAAGSLVKIDMLELIPVAEGYGTARRTARFETPLTFSARDEFDQPAGALAGKTAPVGGVWAGAGDADDFQVETAGKTAQRAVGGDINGNTGRYEISGVAAFAAQTVQVDVKAASNVHKGAIGVLARYVNVNNWIFAHVNGLGASAVLGENNFLQVTKNVAGAGANLGPGFWDLSPVTGLNKWYSLRFMVDAAGRWYLWWGDAGTTLDLIGSGQDAAFATGGALASGKPGIDDYHTESSPISTRNLDNFLAFVPTANAVLFANRKLEVRALGDDVMLRQDLAGTYYGTPPEARSARFWLPAGGASRVAVKARRNDVETLPDDQIADGVKLQVAYRARSVNFPRSA